MAYFINPASGSAAVTPPSQTILKNLPTFKPTTSVTVIPTKTPAADKKDTIVPDAVYIDWKAVKTDITSLTIYSDDNLDLSDLAYFNNLTSLTLYRSNVDCEYILSLPNLFNISYLCIICEKDDAVTINTETLSAYKDISFLELEHVIIEDFNSIGGMNDLRRLEIRNTDVRCDLTPLSSVTTMTFLVISNSAISDISALSSMKDLRMLDLSNNAICNIEPLSRLTNLLDVNLIGNAINDITPLTKLHKLHTLYVSCDGENVTDLRPLADLTGLEFLELYNVCINDISPIKKMTELETLIITGGNNTYHDLSVIDNIKYLDILWLEGSGIPDLAPLNRNENRILEVTLFFDGFDDLSPLNKVNAFFIELKSDSYVDLSPLIECKLMSSLYLYGDGFTDIMPLTHSNGRLHYLYVPDIIDIEQILAVKMSLPDCVIINSTSIYVPHNIDDERLKSLETSKPEHVIIYVDVSG